MEINKSSYYTKKSENREHPKFDREKLMQSAKLFIEAIGDDPNREGLIGTPDRVARAAEELFEGMCYTNQEIADMYNTTFETTEDNDDLVTVVGIPVTSFCEHHIMMMYDMTVSIGYIPVKGKVIGLSKISRIAEMCAHRLQLQEKLGEDIAECISLVSGSPDVCIVIKGKHSCQVNRGSKSNAITKTATLKGRFKTNSDLRKEFYSLID